MLPFHRLLQEMQRVASAQPMTVGCAPQTLFQALCCHFLGLCVGHTSYPISSHKQEDLPLEKRQERAPQATGRGAGTATQHDLLPSCVPTALGVTKAGQRPLQSVRSEACRSSPTSPLQQGPAVSTRGPASLPQGPG